MEKKGELKINARSFISTLCILFVIMIFAGVLTRVLPQGSFERITDPSGNVEVVEGSYQLDEDAHRLPVWRWFTAPFEVIVRDENSLTAIVIIVFILLVGGTFCVLDKAGVFGYVISSTIRRFGGKKYMLLSVICLICMLLGSTIGLLEETVPLVPLLVSLAVALGWDKLVGVGMSMLAVGVGFAAGTFNPFTVGITQQLCGLPAYSGMWLRLIVFVIMYAVLLLFLIPYARKVEKHPEKSLVYDKDSAAGAQCGSEPESRDKHVRRAAVAFMAVIAVIFAYVLTALTVPGMSDYSMPVMAVALSAGGIIAGKLSHKFEKGVVRDFLRGILNILPCVLFILMSMSVRYIVATGGVMDTILNWTYNMIKGLSPIWAVLIVYALVLILEFFISSAASKAFLIMPLIIPLADMIGLTRQSVVLAYCFGDGFTNVIFPTNALLLIVLGLTGIPYAKWFRFSWKTQVAMLVVSCAVLMFGVWIGYN